MRVGIHYCGGCNPYYDRTVLVYRMKRDFPEHMFEHFEASCQYDVLIMICGCSAQCVTVRDATFGIIEFISAEKDYDRVFLLLQSQKS